MLRHAQSAPDPSIPEPDWPLSNLGEQQANDLAITLLPLAIDGVFSSPYQRAETTVRPFCQLHGFTCDIEWSLRERKLKEAFVEDWWSLFERSWQDFDFALENCESSRVCQQRMIECISRLARENPGKTLLASSHGSAISLYLNYLDNDYGIKQWQAMNNPDLFKVDFIDGQASWDKNWRSGFLQG